MLFIGAGLLACLVSITKRRRAYQAGRERWWHLAFVILAHLALSAVFVWKMSHTLPDAEYAWAWPAGFAAFFFPASWWFNAFLVTTMERNQGPRP
jgi:hypothetical protein